MFVKKIAQEGTQNLQIIWLHGWGSNHTILLPLATLLGGLGDQYLLDLPGFGASALPDTPWGVQDYADEVAKFIKTLPQKKTLVIGHSFGGRVAVWLANKYPRLVDGIVLLGGAGLPRKRSVLFKIYAYLGSHYGKVVKKIFPFVGRFSSADYRQTDGLKREIFIKTINEDLTPVARGIKKPVLLVYGENDNQTPVEIGQRYHNLIEGSTLFIIPEQDHWSILTLQQTAAFINNFIMENIL